MAGTDGSETSATDSGADTVVGEESEDVEPGYVISVNPCLLYTSDAADEL